jgi:DNA polymerase III delta prime subunit
MMKHHAFAIEAEAEEGIKAAQAWAEKELGMKMKNPSTKLGASNPDIVILRYGLFSVDDARRVLDVAASAPFVGDYKVIIIAASRAYHEAQNALLKLFEEPPRETYIFLILPTLGGLLPTLRSRVQILNDGFTKPIIPEVAKEFLEANKEKRTALIKKLASGKDEEERRFKRDEAIAIVNGIEMAAYKKFKKRSVRQLTDAALLSDITILRSYLHDRSAPVKMILEHLSLVIPEKFSER